MRNTEYFCTFARLLCRLNLHTKNIITHKKTINYGKKTIYDMRR